MVQLIIVIALALTAAFLLGRRVYLNLSGKQTPGCEKCAANELSKKPTH